MKKIELYADGLSLNEFNDDFGIEIDGYTFNPSLFKKITQKLLRLFKKNLRKIKK